MTKAEEAKKLAFQKALNHTMQHGKLDEAVFRKIHLIENNEGSRINCLLGLNSYAEANAIVAWFRDEDLTKFKEWSYLSAKLQRLEFQCNPIVWFAAYKLFYALLSDNSELISWYRQFHLPFSFNSGAVKDRDNPRQPEFHAYQALLALKGEWDELRQRCELILSTDLKKDKKYLIDHRFYLALANGDKNEMENVLAELTSPKIARVRNYGMAFAFTEHFISTFATLYAKLAWMWGYELEMDTLFIPKEWLPIAPLETYPEPWDFMKDFEIFTPLDAPWTQFSPIKK